MVEGGREEVVLCVSTLGGLVVCRQCLQVRLLGITRAGVKRRWREMSCRGRLGTVLATA